MKWAVLACAVLLFAIGAAAKRDIACGALVEMLNDQPFADALSRAIAETQTEFQTLTKAGKDADALRLILKHYEEAGGDSYAFFAFVSTARKCEDEETYQYLARRIGFNSPIKKF